VTDIDPCADEGDYGEPYVDELDDEMDLEDPDDDETASTCEDDDMTDGGPDSPDDVTPRAAPREGSTRALLPISKMVYPTNLIGQANGRLDASLLAAQSYPNTQNAKLHVLASRVFKALDAIVLEQFGDIYTVTSAADGYRTFQQQYNTFIKRWTTDVLPDRPRKWCMGQYWYLKPGYASSACPGNSNHGWGLARDTGIWVAGRLLSIVNARSWLWLQQNAGPMFKVSWESQSEPWHIRYNGGDDIPQAVLDWEAGQSGGFIVNATRSEIMLGSSGGMVKRWQTHLNLFGHKDQDGQPLKVDGRFGGRTDFATKDFQTKNNLTVDGKVGPNTWGVAENKEVP
jgi:peptidoglycan hydrolase-like protein with peptidoglycan-binding domain